MYYIVARGAQAAFQYLLAACSASTAQREQEREQSANSCLHIVSKAALRAPSLEKSNFQGAIFNLTRHLRVAGALNIQNDYIHYARRTERRASRPRCLSTHDDESAGERLSQLRLPRAPTSKK
jgi:hypothetical protein